MLKDNARVRISDRATRKYHCDFFAHAVFRYLVTRFPNNLSAESIQLLTSMHS